MATIEPHKNQPNNPWLYSTYKGSRVPIPLRIMSGPNTPADITGYSFGVRGKIAVDQPTAMFDLGNDAFTIVNASQGLVYFMLPDDVLAALQVSDYISQVTMTKDDIISKSHMFTIRILDSI